MATAAFENLPERVRQMFDLSPELAGAAVLIRFGRDTWNAGYEAGLEDGHSNVEDNRADNPFITVHCQAPPYRHCLRLVADGYRMCPEHLAQYQELVRPV